MSADERDAEKPRAVFHDAHCHLNFIANAEQVAEQAQKAEAAIFCNCVTPEEYQVAHERFAPYPTVRVGVGLHPWWVDDRVEDRIDLFERLAADAPYVGEVGLDFSPKHRGTAPEQRRAFERIARLCARSGGKTLSIHAVKSADAVLDILCACKAVESCSCIFHWFSGSSDDLNRAIGLGCRFSIGPRMLETKRGRAYAQAIPRRLMLLETDWPAKEGDECTFDQLQEELARTATEIAEARREPKVVPPGGFESPFPA